MFCNGLFLVSLCVLFYRRMFSTKASIIAKRLGAGARVRKRSPVYRSRTVSHETGSLPGSLSVNMQNSSVPPGSDKRQCSVDFQSAGDVIPRLGSLGEKEDKTLSHKTSSNS